MGDYKHGISLSLEDLTDPTPDDTVMPAIPNIPEHEISTDTIIIKNISNALREIDLGRDKEIRIEPKKELTVPKSILDHPQFKAFKSSFIVKGVA